MDEDDDWLDGGDAHQGSSSDPIVEQEYQRLATRYSDAGYREGITDGKLSTLQQGFDSSFATSVPLSRRLGSLRGQAAALLSYLTRSSTSNSSPINEERQDLIDSVRDLIKDLSRVKRTQVLPRDLEREKHGQEEHGDYAFELDQNDKREMEGLEDALGAMGNGGDKGGLREEALLKQLEGRLEGLKATMREVVMRS